MGVARQTAGGALLVLLLAAAAPGGGAAAKAKAFVNQASRLTPEQKDFIERLWAAPLGLNDNLLRAGNKHELEGRNWARLVAKLAAEDPAQPIHIVAFGGSVTVGYRLSNTSYPEAFVAWLSAAFPRANVTLTNLARRATAATFAALCLVQELPPDADLVLVEYSVNGYGGECQCFTSPQTAGYETLLRKVLTRSPRAALLGFAAFMWLDKEGRPGRFYETGEDQHAVVARRYGMPVMSVRDALYDVMFDANNAYGVNRSAILVDIVHVGDYGAGVYASFLAWALRHQATRALLHHHRGLDAAAARAPPALPPPLNPEAAQEDWPTFCAEGLGLQKYVGDNTGWEWVDEGTNACAGCHRYGYLTNAPGSVLTVRVNSDVLSDADRKASAKVMLALTFLKSYSNVGKARVECASGCACAAKVFDAKNSRPTSELHTERMEVGPGAECLLRFTILDETSTGGHKFRLASVAVHKADKVMSYAYGPGGAEYEEFTAWLERNGLLVQGLGPGTALQLMSVTPLQGTLCRALGGGTVLVAETDEPIDALTQTILAPRTADGARADRDAALAAWGAAHPSLPAVLGPRLLLSPRPDACAPQGLFLAFGTRRRGLLYHVASAGWDKDRRTRVRSVGKCLACLVRRRPGGPVVLRLQQAGVLSMADPISAHLASWDRPDKRHITLAHLLNHISGLQVAPDHHPAASRPDITLDAAAAMLAELPVLSPPGEKFRYWGAGYQVVGAVVEKVCGKPWNEAFDEHVARPLGLTATAFCDTAASGPRPTNPCIGAGCVSTPGDLLRLVVMLVHGGAAAGADALADGSDASPSERFISPELFDLLITDQSHGADPSGCPLSSRLMRPADGAHLYINALRGAGVIDDQLTAAALAQADGIHYALGGWPSSHATTGLRSFNSLGYFGNVVHIARCDTDDPTWMLLLAHARYSSLWQVYFSALERAAGVGV
ncbi:pbpX [Scenedesmus sp. PABB004]|nr:pbpX [Scenedesmus sp. PABB004]